MKKTTMKDIALQAGVSVATVSYVLNNASNQTIPETTRRQILQIAKEMNYIPNLAARSLVKKRTGLIGILINRSPDSAFWVKQRYLSFISTLETFLTANGQHTVLFSLDPDHPQLDIIMQRKLDAVFLIDVKDEVFYTISSNFGKGVPLILIDCMVEDPLFNQIVFDYEGAFKLVEPINHHEYCLLIDHYNNQSLIDYIRVCSGLSNDNIVSIRNQKDLDDFIAVTSYSHVIVSNEFIARLLERTNRFESITVLCSCHASEILNPTSHAIRFLHDKALTAFELMDSLLNRSEYHTITNHRYVIGVDCHS